MRVPTVLTKCKIVAGVAVLLMTVGQVYGSPAIRSLSILVGILAAAMFIRAAVNEAAETIQIYVRQWSHQAFEAGFRGGVEQGRAMEASERFIEAARSEGN